MTNLMLHLLWESLYLDSFCGCTKISGEIETSESIMNLKVFDAIVINTYSKACVGGKKLQYYRNLMYFVANTNI